jgi:acyl-CoA synthetase (NDP forming)
MSMDAVTTGSKVDLTLFYRPRSIAVIGAHETRNPNADNSRRLLATAQAIGAEFYPVHPRFESVFGAKCYRSINEIPGDIDVLIVQVSDAAAAIREASAKHPKFAVVFTSGYGETGIPEAIEREQQLLEAAREVGARLLGPNTNINGLELRRSLAPPKIALVTQSGAQGRPIIQSEALGVAFSFWATTGNEADLEASDFIEFFSHDPETTVVSAYIEGFKSGQRLREAALAALEHEVSIVMIKVGRSEVGRAMAASHTAHLTGSDRVFDAFFEQYGITRVSDLDELREVSVALARLKPPRVSGVVVYGMSGGTAAHLGDLVAEAGLELPRLSEATQARLRELIPDYLVVHNPVDNGGITMGQGNGPAQMEVVMSDPAMGVLLYAIPGVYHTTSSMVDSLQRAIEVSDAPVMAIWSGPTTDDASFDRLVETKIPIFRNYRNAIVAAKALIRKHEQEPLKAKFIEAARKLPPIASPYAGEVEDLDEFSSAAWLSERGIKFAEHRAVATVSDAVVAADELGYPVVLKARGRTIIHKSEHGLVALGLRSRDQVRDRATDMLRGSHRDGIEGFLVARQAEPGLELLVGISNDPILGPVVTIGAGGVTAEAMNDVAISVLPLLPERANQMLAKLRLAPLLNGWRGQPGVRKEALVEVLMILAELATTGDVEELDINPLIAYSDKCLALDAFVRLRRP